MAVEQDDVLRVTAEMSIAGADIQNVLHFRSTNAAPILETTALGDMADIMDALYTIINGGISVDLSYDSVRVQNVTQDILLGSALWPVLTAGVGGGDRMADQCAALITMATATPKVRGGVFLGGYFEAANDSDSSLTAVVTADLVDFAAELLIEQVFGANSYRYVVFNRLLGSVVLPVASIIHAAWRTQKRRRQGVGS